MSICWLYLIADEVVSVLQALGLLASISTGMGFHYVSTYEAWNCNTVKYVSPLCTSTVYYG